MYFLQWQRFFLWHGGLGERGFLRVGGVAAVGAEDDGILAAVGEQYELLGVPAANRAGVGFDDNRIESAARENVLIGLYHCVVAHVQSVLIGVEAVGVLHVEFADADEPGARTRFVPEFRLNLVERDGQIAIAEDVRLDDVCQEFFRCGREYHPPISAIQQAHHVGSVLLVAPGLLPYLSWLEHGHVKFLAAGRVHLLSDDLLDLSDGPPRKGQIAVHAHHRLMDHASSEHQFMAIQFGLCRIVSQCLAESPGHSHWFIPCVLFISLRDEFYSLKKPATVAVRAFELSFPEISCLH